MTFLGIEEIAESQAAKHITHNIAVRKLRVLSQLTVISAALATPPATPATGDAYIVASPATGAWLGWENRVAFWSDAGWSSLTPARGWNAWVQAQNAFFYWNGTAWVAWQSSGVVKLDDLTDVAITSPAPGQVVAYDGSTWRNTAPPAQPVMLPFFYPGKPGNGATLWRIVATLPITLPVGLSGSAGSLGINPTAAATLTLRRNGTDIGTVSISTAGVVTFTLASAITLAPGDIFSAHNQSTADATLADVSITVAGTR